jgi:hypothetical protein
MTAKITASTSSGLVLDSDLSGSLALVANGITVATLNGTGANAGIQMGTSMAPAFSAYQSSAQTLSNNTNTKISFQTEEYDTNGNFDSTTNYRFTPTVAGYYQFSTAIQIASSATPIILSFHKNGSISKRIGQTNSSSVSLISGSALIYCNGSTDYIEVYAQITTGQALDAAADRVYFQGFLARSA